MDLAINAGLCCSGSGIDFMVGKNKEELYATDDSVKFDEAVFEHLAQGDEYEQYRRRHTNKQPKKGFDLLFNLDPYGRKKLSQQDMQQLMVICDTITANYSSDELNDRKVRYFADRLKELCQKAIAENLMMMAVGD
ncbi:hypothetical protein ACFQPF_05280 [Fictibacillus iocasae]|uniref:Uncharacterized protein n=1 Tax=Fictibacillus iocasae TaxID=2715437 RepID=A0ABW2NNK6_9BACL